MTRSPFPGMDPYLEDPAFWPGFHLRAIPICTEILYEHLPPGYDADVGERVQLVDYPALEAQPYLPDVDVTLERNPAISNVGRPPDDAVATLEPVSLPITETREEPYAFVEIYRRPDRELVTVIELLSPSNKAGAGIGDYRRKRQDLLGRGVHLVEIDLLIGGRRLPTGRVLPVGDYYAFVTRYESRPNANVYSWDLRRPLPTVPVQLKSPEPDVPLDLAAVVALTYERGRYARKLRYDSPTPVLLAAEKAAWADLVIRSRT